MTELDRLESETITLDFKHTNTVNDEVTDFAHIPVLYNECLNGLNIKKTGIYVDCTAGGGGHSAGILARLDVGGQLLAFDKDKVARAAAELKLQQVASAGKFMLVPADFRNLKEELQLRNINKVDGILADLGVSSYQLDTGERGFAYSLNGPLDMRMNPDSGSTAADLLQTLDCSSLAKIFRVYGEEKYALAIAKRIVKERELSPLTKTEQLVELIYRAIPNSARKEKQHPAKRVFQALRIAVNGELDALESLLHQAIEVLNPEGRLVVISFHSLEDRIIKQQFRQWERPCICPTHLPCICGLQPLGAAEPNKGITASPAELATNHRSRSARVRIFRKF